MRNGNEDYIYSAVTVSNSNTFTMPVNNSGGTSGDQLAYVPAFSASANFATAGDLSSLTITAPGATSGSCQLHSLMLFTTVQETIPTVTVPKGPKEGAGDYNFDATINMPLVRAFTGNNNNTLAFTVTPVIDLSDDSNLNIIEIAGMDNLVSEPMYCKIVF